MQLDDLERVPRTRRLRWHNHVERIDSWLKSQETQSCRSRDRGRPKKTWLEVIRLDCLAPGLTDGHPAVENLGIVRFEICRQTGP